MKNKFGFLPPLLRLVVFFAAMAAFGAHAQESTEPEVEPEIVGAESTESPAPPMRRLFFSAGERMTLEILRRDAAAAELEEITKVFPVILHEEPFAGGAEVVLARDEEIPLEISAMVRRHSDGKTFLWIGDEGFDLQKDGMFLDKTSHLIMDSVQVSSDGIIGIDRISKRRFRVLVGQSIDAEGKVRDNYPAIVVRNKKR
ncbi:MAG: hypothetical protein ACR2P4_07430 [Gammaproteobacteria bacterium]